MNNLGWIDEDTPARDISERLNSEKYITEAKTRNFGPTELDLHYSKTNRKYIKRQPQESIEINDYFEIKLDAISVHKPVQGIIEAWIVVEYITPENKEETFTNGKIMGVRYFCGSQSALIYEFTDFKINNKNQAEVLNQEFLDDTLAMRKTYKGFKANPIIEKSSSYICKYYGI